MVERDKQQQGNYRLIQLLGSSEVAEVYLGEHLLFKTLAAIKILRVPVPEHDMPAFLRELKALAGLIHPNIARILDFGVQDGTGFLAMEYAPGDTLRQSYSLVARWQPAAVMSLIERIANALQYAHDQNIVHGDVRPENILFGEDHEVLLSDFGLATLLRTMDSQHAQLARSNVYMAPEQIDGSPRPAGDQYALAVVTYEWLNGKLPGQDASHENGGQRLVSPGGNLLDLSSEVSEVLNMAMESDPTRRFGSVQAFATALGQAFAGEAARTVSDESLFMPATMILNPLPTLPTQRLLDQPEGTRSESEPTIDLGQYRYTEALPASGVPQTLHPYQPEQVSQAAPDISRRKTSRRAVLIGLGGGAVLIGGAITLVASGKVSALFARSSAAATRVPVKTPVHPATATPSAQPTATPQVPPGTTFTTYTGQSSDVTGVCWSPEANSRTVASCSQDGSAASWDALTGQVDMAIPQSGALNTLVWSPNNQYIACGGADNVVTIWEVASGSLQTTCTGHTRPVLGLAWSPNSQSIVSTSQDDSAIVWDVATGNKLIVYNGHSNYVWSVAWSPDGSAIATGGWDNTVQIWNPNTGSLMLRYPTAAPVRAVDWSPDGSAVASGGDDNLVQVWQAVNGTVQATYRGHSDHVETVQWSPDGQRIASSSKDATVQIWQASNANQIYTYLGHSALVWSLAWSPDGQLIVSGSQDRTARVWQAV